MKFARSGILINLILSMGSAIAESPAPYINGDDVAEVRRACDPLMQEVAKMSGGNIAFDSNNHAFRYRKDVSINGSQIADYSFAGYRRGELPPRAGIKVELAPLGRGRDDTKQIQNAINEVGGLPFSSRGFRGAVYLTAGTYYLNGSLTIQKSGVVLRGTRDTHIIIRGTPRTVINIGAGSISPVPKSDTAELIQNISSGRSDFWVENYVENQFQVGMPVRITRRVTSKWIQFMQMDQLIRDAGLQTWIADDALLTTDRVITRVSGRHISVDAPFTDSLDMNYGTAFAQPLVDTRIFNVGLDRLDFLAPKVPLAALEAGYVLLEMDNVVDGFVREVIAQDFKMAFNLGRSTKQISLIDVKSTKEAALIVANTEGGAKILDIMLQGQQALILRGITSGVAYMPVSTMSSRSQLNAVVGMRNINADPDSYFNIGIQPHMRWSTGLLTDNVSSPQGGISYVNRETCGSGHGWSMGFGVAWHNVANVVMENPPGSRQWSYGNSAQATSDYTSMRRGTAAAATKSLYLAQLCTRLGPSAVTKLGYTFPQ